MGDYFEKIKDQVNRVTEILKKKGVSTHCVSVRCSPIGLKQI